MEPRKWRLVKKARDACEMAMHPMELGLSLALGAYIGAHTAERVMDWLAAALWLLFLALCLVGLRDWLTDRLDERNN